MNDTVVVREIEGCDLCRKAGRSTPAVYDGKTREGPWAFMCEDHFTLHGIGLGTGKGQRLIVREPHRITTQVTTMFPSAMSPELVKSVYQRAFKAYEEVILSANGSCDADTLTYEVE